MSKRHIFSWVILISVTLIIYYFSSQNGNVSGKQSELIHKSVIEFFNKFSHNFNITDDHVRGFAHFSLFFLIGISGASVYFYYSNKTKKNIIILLFLCSIIGIADEFHQLFVQGRSASFFDLVIDFTGIIFGVVLYLISSSYKRKYDNFSSKL